MRPVSHKKTVDLFRVFLFRIEGKISFQDYTQSTVLQIVQAVIKKIQIEDILAGYAGFEQTPHKLEHESRFSAATHSDTNGRLPRDRRNCDAARYARRQLNFLKVQDNLF